MADLLLTICQNLLYLIMAAAVTSFYAFMLPVPTAPNAIVFRASTCTMCFMVMVEALNTMALGAVLTGSMKA